MADVNELLLSQQRRWSVSSPFVPDEDPNVSEPDPRDTFVFQRQVPSQPQLYTSGILLLPVFNNDDVDATVDVIVWVKVLRGGGLAPVWASLKPEIGAKHGALYKEIGTMLGRVFLQVTAVSPTVADELVISVGETGI